MNEVALASSRGLVPAGMDEALRLAEFMSRARTLPRHLHESPGDCLMVVEQAMRWGMSPFAVAQATSVISGKMMFEGKLVSAAVENSGAIVGHIDYSFSGEGDARSITVSATRRGETNPRTVIVSLKEARTANEMWKRQPDQQLVYHGTRVWARRWTPAVILGVYSREEIGPVIEGQIASDEAETPTAPAVPDPPTPPTRAPNPKSVAWKDRVIKTMAQAQSEAALDELRKKIAGNYGACRTARPDMADEIDNAERAARERIRAITSPGTDNNWEDPGNDPIAELIAEVEAMDAIALDGLATNAAWRAKTRDLFPPDEDRLADAIAARKVELTR